MPNTENMNPRPTTEVQDRYLEDQYQDNRELYMYSQKGNIKAGTELELYKAKKDIDTDAAIALSEARQWIKTSEEEIRRQTYQMISIADGQITVQTQNLKIDTVPRKIVNMTNPKLCQLIRLEKPSDSAWQLLCLVNESSKCIFLDSAKLGSGTYLLSKFAAHGIFFCEDAETNQKKWARQLIALLLSNAVERAYIPDEHGWTQLSSGEFRFYKKGVTTWTLVKQLIK
jgi:hypothetical protein